MSGIYIHIPFCKQACHYCDFHFSTSLKMKDKMLSALKVELMLRKDEFKDVLVETIYFGGGTPSLLPNEDLEWLISLIKIDYNVSPEVEITIEANPDDLTYERINELKNSPINRLSIGIQSFFDDDLKAMNRAHNASESKKCLEEATKHFDNITIDLIYGIPTMSLDKWKKNLQIAFNFGVNHISSYALTVEPKTALDSFIKKGKYPPIDEELALDHFKHLVQATVNEGFIQYEISNFGKPNFFSKHNTSYWLGKPYLGIGPSAHSYNGTERSWNIANNSKYINSILEWKLPLTIEQLSVNDMYNEYIMTGLRTIWGVSLSKIEQDFGEECKSYIENESIRFINEGYLIKEEGVIKVAEKGKFLVDGIASELFMI